MWLAMILAMAPVEARAVFSSAALVPAVVRMQSEGPDRGDWLAAKRSRPPKKSKPAPPNPPSRGRYTCPATVETLMPLLLRDLPGYVNRVVFRSVRSANAQNAQNPLADRAGFSSAILAGQPEFTPLPVAATEYAQPEDKNLRQVFFTVLERRYSGDRPETRQMSEWQQYHWLFLADTPQGWQLVFLFSRLGAFPAGDQPVTPPRDATQSATAAAVRLWLRDCQAGAVKP